MTPQDEPQKEEEGPAENQAGSKLEDMERGKLLEALERNRWVQSRAAKELGITLRMLGYRLKKYHLEETVKQQRRRLVRG